jgi:protein-disulfide isomerase
MVLKLGTVALVALFSLSPPIEQDTAALKREIEALKAQQAEMQKDLDAIRAYLQQMIVEKAQAAMVNAPISVANAPARGAAAAKVMMVEVSDYHCPFCRRHTLATQPQIDTEYINTGKVRYVFVDYPIDQLHPDAFKAHEAANCAGEQGKYWEMHLKLFEQPPPRDGSQLGPLLSQQAQSVGVDAGRFKACMDSGKYAKPVKENVERMATLGVDSTPTFLLGLTPPPGQPMKVLKVVRGAVPFAQFKATIDPLLAGDTAATK